MTVKSSKYLHLISEKCFCKLKSKRFFALLFVFVTLYLFSFIFHMCIILFFSADLARFNWKNNITIFSYYEIG